METIAKSDKGSINTCTPLISKYNSHIEKRMIPTIETDKIRNEEKARNHFNKAI